MSKLYSKVYEVGGTPLDKMREILALDLQKVDEIICNTVKNKVTLIPEISNHTITSGGKRLRPMLTLACAKMCGYRGSAHIDLAASIEFMHTATLLHDDVVDKSSLRRGVLTANNVWGNKESILVGDFLLGKSFELMGSACSLEVYKVLSNAATVISEGEVRQLAATGKLDITEDEYFEIINAKTAKLFAAACQIGGVVAGVPSVQVEALMQYGINLGQAFQIIDDMLDYEANQEILGKNVGDDFREKKITLPVIISYRNVNQEGRAFWQRCFAKNTAYDPSSLRNAVKIINSSGARLETIKTAESIAKKAAESLSVFPDTLLRQVLLDVLDFVVVRDF